MRATEHDIFGTGEPLDLRGHIAILRRQKWFILIVIVLVAFVGLGASVLQPASYSATSQVSFALLYQDERPVIDLDLDLERSRVMSPETILRAASRLGSTIDEDLLEQIQVEFEPDNRSLEISAIASRPTSAAQISKAVATAYLDLHGEDINRRARELQEQVDLSQSILATLQIRRSQILDDLNALSVLEEDDSAIRKPKWEEEKTSLSDQLHQINEEVIAIELELHKRRTTLTQLEIVLDEVARSHQEGGTATGYLVPASPLLAARTSSPMRTGMLSLALAALVGIGSGYLRDRNIGIVHDETDLARIIGTDSMLGRLPDAVEAKTDHELDLVPPAGSIRDLYREVGTALRAALFRSRLGASEPYRHVDPGFSVLIASIDATIDSTEIAYHIAAFSAQAGWPTQLVEADLRQPNIASRLGLASNIGLAEILRAYQVPVSESLYQYSAELAILPGGSQAFSEDGTDLLASPAMQAVHRSLVSGDDLTIYSVPPLDSYSDALQLALEVDLVVLLIRLGGVKQDRILDAVRRLHLAGSRSIVFVAA